MQFSIFGYLIRITKEDGSRPVASKAGGIDLAKRVAAEPGKPDWSGRIFDPQKIYVSGAVNLDLDQRDSAPLTVYAGNPDDLDLSFFENRGKKSLVLKIREHGSRVRVTMGAPFCEFIDVSGAGTVISSNIDQSELCIDATGRATVKLEGAVGTLHVNAAGAADVIARKLKADEVEVYGSGGSDIEVYAARSITANLSGSCDLDLWGKPKSSRLATSGSAAVKKH